MGVGLNVRLLTQGKPEENKTDRGGEMPRPLLSSDNWTELSVNLGCSVVCDALIQF